MIYLCYGMTKSASTYLYQLTEEVLFGAGLSVCRIRQPGRVKLENYYDRITPRLLDAIESRAEGRTVVLKTHGRLDADVAARIAEGRIKASATFRDPREIALSMADNGARSRQLRILPFAEVVEPEDAMPSIDMQLAYFDEWRAVPRLEVFSYNEVCFATGRTIRRLCGQIGIDVDNRKAAAPFENRMLIGQFNVAKPLRYRDMNEATQAAFLQRYAALYASVDMGEDLISPGVGVVEHRSRGAWSHRLESALRLVRRTLKTKSLGTIST